MVVAVLALMFCLLASLTINFLLVRMLQKAHRDECTRLMCRDAAEFKAVTDDTVKQQVETPHQRAIRQWREKGDK